MKAEKQFNLAASASAVASAGATHRLILIVLLWCIFHLFQAFVWIFLLLLICGCFLFSVYVWREEFKNWDLRLCFYGQCFEGGRCHDSFFEVIYLFDHFDLTFFSGVGGDPFIFESCVFQLTCFNCFDVIIWAVVTRRHDHLSVIELKDCVLLNRFVFFGADGRVGAARFPVAIESGYRWQVVHFDRQRARNTPHHLCRDVGQSVRGYFPRFLLLSSAITIHLLIFFIIINLK